MTPAVRTVARARFKTVKAAEAIDVEVHFNPASLQYTVSNTLDKGQGGKKQQYVSQTTAKLTMDLLFDTTHTGQDVRGAKTPAPGQPAGTDQMVKLLKPNGPSGKRAPPRVEFSWGAYRFEGIVEQYKETLDYFSPEGVPLRASINLTLTTVEGQEVQFDSAHNPNAAVDGQPSTGEAVMVPTSTGPGGGPSGVSSALGDPRAARAIATTNGSASLRFSAGAELAVAASGGGEVLLAEVAFSAGASAGAGFGIGASAGAGFGIGAGASASAGLSFGASASAGAGIGVGASGGAFAGLRVDGSANALALPDPGAVFSARATAQASAGPLSSAIGVGGRALATGSASLSADVNGGASLRFDA